MTVRVATPFARADSWESSLCIAANRMTNVTCLRHYFQLMTRLGNGIIWYVTIAAAPLLDHINGLQAATHIGLTALVGVTAYKACKRILIRERPFVTHAELACYGKPLDRGSFPSGHTLHATTFAIMLGSYYPNSVMLFGPLGLSIAMSRIALGHHYPSDVLAGALLGCLLGLVSLTLPQI